MSPRAFCFVTTRRLRTASQKLFFENLQDLLYFIICSILLVEVGFWPSTHAHLEPPWRARSHTPRSRSRAPKNSMRLITAQRNLYMIRPRASANDTSQLISSPYVGRRGRSSMTRAQYVHSMLSRSVERQRFRVGRRKGFSGEVQRDVAAATSIVTSLYLNPI